MTVIFIDDGYCGSGKTYRAIQTACQSIIAENRKTVIAVPTRRLARQVQRDGNKQFGGVAKSIKCIVSSVKGAESAISRITKFVMDREEGCLLIITHAALQMVEHWARKREWHLVVDEEINSEVHIPVRLRRPETRAALLGLFRINQFNDVYSALEATDHSRIADIRDHLYDDSIDEMFAPLTMRLLHNSPWNLYVKTSAFEEFQSGKTNRFDVHGLLDPRVLLEGFASVRVMAANIHDTLMVKYWKAIGQSTIKVNGKAPVSVGHRLTIKYLPVPKWSKRLRDMIVDEEGISVGNMYDALCADAAMEHDPSGRHMFVTNKDNDDLEFIGNQLPNIPHGMNDQKDRAVCAIFSALNVQPAHEAFLLNMLQITERELRRAKISQMVYQAAFRGVLRIQESDEKFLILVPDSSIADDIASLAHCAGCHVEPLTTPYEVPQVVLKSPGRPSPYASEEDRKAAKREQNRRSIAKKREIERMCTENTIRECDLELLPTPPQPPTPVHQSSASSTFLISKWDSQTASPVPSWAADIWQMENYRHFGGNWRFTTQEFFDYLEECATGHVFTSKKDNQLIMPSVFDLSRDPDHGHSYSNLVTSQGLILDFDHTDATPDEIADVLAPYPCVIYSSWSHRHDDCSYRACIPTSSTITRDVTRILLCMVRDKFEKRGFVPRHETGKKHGIDASALNASKLYYLPCKRPDSFFQTYRVDAQPIAPIEWVKAASEEVIETAVHLARPVVPLQDQAPGYKDRRIQGATGHFRRQGCIRGEGRRMMYGLYKSLIEIGCDNQEAAGIMYREATHYSNVSERRTEVQKHTGFSL